MGCWNGTCMISNLPIIHGEKIKLVFLQKGYNKQSIIGESGYVYSTGIMCPAFLPITGEYDDYGSVENFEEDWNYEKIESTLRTKFGNIIYVDGIEKADWKLIDLINGIERTGEYTEQPQYYNPNNGTKLNCDLSFVMIRQDVWDLCVEIQGGREVYSNPDYSNNENQPYQINGEKYGKRVFNTFIESIRKEFDNPFDEFKYLMTIERELRHIFSDSFESKPYMFNYRTLCKIRKNEDIFLQDIKKRWYEQLMINSILQNLRKGWMIQPGAGSQTSDWDLYTKFNNGVNLICNEKNNMEW